MYLSFPLYYRTVLSQRRALGASDSADDYKKAASEAGIGSLHFFAWKRQVLRMRFGSRAAVSSAAELYASPLFTFADEITFLSCFTRRLLFRE